MHKLYLFLLCCSLAFILNASNQAPGIVLAENGSSSYQIVTPDEPADEEQRAAAELQH